MDCCWNITHGLKFCEARFLQIVDLHNKAERWFGGNDFYSTSAQEFVEEIDELRIFLRDDDFLCRLFMYEKINKLQNMRKTFNDDELLSFLLLEGKIVL